MGRSLVLSGGNAIEAAWLSECCARGIYPGAARCVEAVSAIRSTLRADSADPPVPMRATTRPRSLPSRGPDQSFRLLWRCPAGSGSGGDLMSDFGVVGGTTEAFIRLRLSVRSRGPSAS